ncbi:MAG TPA: GAF domain-containing sensor histidine kinase [Thermoanaerobaculia bacterium]|nr:GAF domain-containing sensor histidine kinase [Thermoanaerobaculia bacterium]
MADSIGPYSGIGWRRRFRLLDSRDLHALAYSFSDYRNSADYRNLAEKYRLGSDQRSFLNSLKFGLLIPLTCSDINLGYVTLSWTEGTPNLAIAAELRSYVESIQATVPLLYSACRSIITDNNLVAFWAAAGTIVSSQSEALCYENIALACLQLWPDSTTYVGRIDPNASGAVIVAVEGRWKEEADQERQRERQIIPFGEGQFGYALTRNEPVISFSLADDNRFTYHSLRENNEYLGSGIAMKLSGLNGEPIAVMSVEHDIKNYFDPEDLRYITGIASLGYEALTVHKETAAILSRDIDTLFTQMLHDVTEPLQAIIADADVLRYEASIEPPKLADDELVKRLDNISVRAANIVEGSLNLYGQVRNLIDAGIEGASTRVTAGRVNLFRLLNSLVDTWGDRAALQGVEIRSLFDSLRGIEVQCDETELLSALGHLIGNAIKYSFWGRRHGDQSGATKYGRYVSIVGRITLSNVLIEIQNYGIGILPSELRRVKEKFYRGHLAIKEGRAGTGRGRWSAEAFFSSIGGRVDVASLYKSSDPTTTNGPYSTTVTAVMPYITSRRNS